MITEDGGTSSCVSISIFVHALPAQATAQFSSLYGWLKTLAFSTM